MPYISNEQRNSLNSSIKQLAMDLKLNGNKKGNLNYAVTSLLLEHLESVGIKYDTLSDVNGVLADVQQEFYRRVTAPYEELKIKTQGDLPFPQFAIKKGGKENG